MKDETKGIPIAEFVGLRSKMYSFVCRGEEEKRLKGVGNATVRNNITFAHYKDVLFSESQKHSAMMAIRSHSHKLFCENISKVSLSAFDDKRYLIDPINNKIMHMGITKSKKSEHCYLPKWKVNILLINVCCCILSLY